MEWIGRKHLGIRQSKNLNRDKMMLKPYKTNTGYWLIDTSGPIDEEGRVNACGPYRTKTKIGDRPNWELVDPREFVRIEPIPIESVPIGIRTTMERVSSQYESHMKKYRPIGKKIRKVPQTIESRRMVYTNKMVEPGRAGRRSFARVMGRSVVEFMASALIYGIAGEAARRVSRGVYLLFNGASKFRR